MATAAKSRAFPRTRADAYGEIVKRCLWNPARFVAEVIGVQPDPWQVEVMQGLLDKRMAAIAGGNGAGKDALSAWLGLWLLCTRPFAKGQVTAPNKDQLFAIFWAELAKWIQHSPILPILVEWQKTRVVWKEHPERWFLVARTAKKSYSHGSDEAAAEGIQGLHEEHAIIIITECSGVEDENWDAAESCCTRPDNYLLAVGNPLRRSGRFYDIFTKPMYQRDWYTRHVSYLESSHADNARHEGWIARYGLDSAYCQVRCFGQFPKQGATDTAIPWDLVMGAMSRDTPLRDGDDLQIGVDCARYGDDESVIAVRVGYAMPEVRTFRQTSGPDLVGHVIQAVHDYGGGQETPIMVDEAGLGGAGIVDPLRQVHGYEGVIGLNNAMRARDQQKYESIDDELMMEVLPQWLAVGTMPYDDVLLAQLTTRKYQFTGKNEQQRRLESKEQLRRRHQPSPDRAEAVMLACAPPPVPAIGISPDQDQEIRRAWQQQARRFGRSSLMRRRF
jgi:phage terminase large subunit